MSISNKDHLNKLISNAKKSWKGVDVDSYISNLRDNLTDKERAEKVQKALDNLIKAMEEVYEDR